MRLAQKMTSVKYSDEISEVVYCHLFLQTKDAIKVDKFVDKELGGYATVMSRLLDCENFAEYTMEAVAKFRKIKQWRSV